MMFALSLFFGLGLLCVVSHELGHFLAARSAGLNPRFGVDKRGVHIKHQWAEKDVRDHIKFMGVLGGYLPAFLALPFSPEITVLLCLAVTMGSIREIAELTKKDGDRI